MLMPDDRRVLRPLTSLLGAATALGLVLGASPARALTLSATATPDLDATIAAEGLGEPTDVGVLPDGRIVVIERQGNVKTFTLGMDDPVQDHIDVDSSHNERGLLGLVIDPDYAKTQFIYVYASQGNDADNRQKILRYKLGADGKLSGLTPVVTMGLMGPANHNGGGISLYKNTLFIGVGDTGANATPPQNHFGSCLNHANGKVLRVSLDEATLGQPPADNPLVNEAMVTGCDGTGSAFTMMPPEKRIYSWGFRNPFRLWADPTTGKVWVGDVGETTKEEIDVVDKGKHYGYPFWEGTVEYNQAFKPANGGCMGMVPATPCVPPVIDHDRGGGGAVIGGRILDGCGWPDAWKKRYIFGDHEQGKVWVADVNDTRDGLVANSRKDFASSSNVVAMRMGTDNALYVVERGGGRVTRITAKAAPPATANSCPDINGAPSEGGGGGGTGGAGGTGTGGSANPGTGGSANPGTGGNAPGTGGTGNTNPTGGNAPTTGGSGNPGTAGTSATSTAGTGTTTSGGTGSATGDTGDDSGCGCRAAGSSGSSLGALAALGAALGVALQRRRRARRS
jgi:MYXO-CTERM domain-containing protein